MESENRSHVSSSTTMLLTIGGILIFLGIIVLIFASWQSFTPTGRIITVLTPLLLLYALAAGTWKREAYHTLSEYLLLTASTILPFVTGVFIYQTQLYHTVDWQLILFSSLFSFVVYAAIEFFLRHKAHAVFTLVSGTIAALSLAVVLNGPAYYYSWSILAAGVLFLVLGWLLRLSDAEWESNGYHGTGTVLTIASLGLMPFLYWTTHDFIRPGFWPPYIISLGYAAVGLVFFGLAAIYSGLWQKYQTDNMLYQVRLAFENASPIALVGPAVVVALGSSDSSHLLVAILLGAICLALSYVVQVRLFRVMGYLAIAFGVLKIIFFAFSQLSAFWPILLLIIGFLFIGLAFLVTHFQSREIFQLLWREPSRSLFRLGEDNPYQPQPANSPVLVVPEEGSPAAKRTGDWKVLLIVIAVLIILSLIR